MEGDLNSTMCGFEIMCSKIEILGVITIFTKSEQFERIGSFVNSTFLINVFENVIFEKTEKLEKKLKFFQIYFFYKRFSSFLITRLELLFLL